jgi:hypothetical protein
LPTGLSPTHIICRQSSLPTDCATLFRCFTIRQSVGNIVSWCSGRGHKKLRVYLRKDNEKIFSVSEILLQ